jgi:F-type H+-transporting ATPase subunit alpha
LLQTRNAAPAINIQARSFADAKAAPTEVSSILEQRIRGVSEESNLAETGRVLSVGYVDPFIRPWAGFSIIAKQ